MCMFSTVYGIDGAPVRRPPLQASFSEAYRPSSCSSARNRKPATDKRSSPVASPCVWKAGSDRTPDSIPASGCALSLSLSLSLSVSLSLSLSLSLSRPSPPLFSSTHPEKLMHYAARHPETLLSRKTRPLRAFNSATSCKYRRCSARGRISVKGAGSREVTLANKTYPQRQGILLSSSMGK